MSADNFLVVGLGASAGGIRAFKEFFANVAPTSGMAYVAILHLSPEHDSHLAEVLQPSCPIPITTVEDRVRVVPDHVYVISPKQSLTMADGWLVQSEATRVEERRAPVDVFFRTLAESHGADSVSIVLSGSGADGSMGLKRIKEKGGICLVQDPGEAEYSDMPRNALATGLVDDVLPVAAMPGRLLAYDDKRSRRLQLPEEPETRQAPDERALYEVFGLLRATTGHDFSNYKRATVLRRVERRLSVREIADLASYAEFIRGHPEEAEALLKDLLISVTNFFRDQEAFAHLERDIVPQLFASKGEEQQVRVWVPGCATGEEAYSIAILLAEYASAAPESPGVQIFATDIDERAVAIAREGLYTLNDAADVSPERLRRFFNKEGSGYRVRKELRETILFAHHNLVKDPPFSRLDLVSCRNLLIYLNRAAQGRVMDVLHFALNPGGYLFLGSSESADGSGDLFATVDKEAHLYQSRGGAPRAVPPLGTVSPGEAARARPHTARAGPGLWERLAAPDLHQRVLECYAPPSVLVNAEHEIVHMSDTAARMLQFAGGEPSHNLLKVVRPELRLELRTALYQAAQHQTDVVARGLAVTLDRGRVSDVDLLVRPVLGADDPAAGHFLVLFDEVRERPTDGADSAARPVDTADPGRQLEEDLARVKSQLRTTVEQYETQTEEMRASNEELQAVNEELRSTTEELETSKEELQSVNEELRTVNQELKVKIDELSQATNDVLNLINSADFGTIFLDRGGRIKLFTPRARDIFSLIPGDRGRPLEDITSHLVDVDLHADVERVIDRLERVEREVETRQGRWYLMQLSPYRTAEDRIEGVVLTFIDITARRLADERLRQSEARLRRALGVDTIGVLFFTMDGTITDSNDAFLRLSGLHRDDVRLNRLQWEGLATAERRRDLRRAFDELRDTGRTSRYELDCVRPDGSTWVAMIAATRLSDQEAAAFVVDITEQQRMAESLQRADRRKNEFLAALAHELRNPLAPIAAALEVLRLSGAVDERAREARDVMERQVSHLIRLVDDLLEVSRVTLGKVELRREPGDLAAILRTAVEASAPAIRTARHTLTIQIAPEPLPFFGDPVRIGQVFTNLLRNAARYTPDGGAIRLTATRVGDQAIVAVADDGLGIAAHELPQIFELFTQGNVLPSGHAQSGLGIGLTLVRSLVEAHGGRVEVTSPGENQGSTFVVTLPLMPVPLEWRDPAPPLAIDLSRHRVLVADDNRDAADSLAVLLGMLGAAVHTAYGGADALTAIAEHEPTIAFIDLGMPGTDGLEVARRVRAEPGPSPPTLVALTGWGLDTRHAVMEAGFDYHVTKPASFARLKEILTAVDPAGAP